jgi:hypothetical protein
MAMSKRITEPDPADQALCSGSGHFRAWWITAAACGLSTSECLLLVLASFRYGSFLE